jgi:hypothetical protein
VSIVVKRPAADTSPAKIIPHPFLHTGMQILRGIPNKYLYAACLVLSFLLFSAGGTAFGQSPFYGGLFIVLAIFMFIVGMYFGRLDTDIE